MHTYSYTDFAGVAVESYNNLNFSITGISLLRLFSQVNQLKALHYERISKNMCTYACMGSVICNSKFASETAGSTTPSFGNSIIGRKSTAKSQVAKRINARRLTAGLVKIENWRRLIEQS
uniref:Uncharacterized protein n=1 Tax=Glossina palpalis gambiensis TaxID=67801 RepID=A0A1B0ARI4_9MUSC